MSSRLSLSIVILCCASVLTIAQAPAAVLSSADEEVRDNERREPVAHSSSTLDRLTAYIDMIDGISIFFYDHRSSLFVDALFGLRLTQAHFVEIFKLRTALRRERPSLYHALVKVSNRVDATVRDGLRSMHAKNSAYTQKLGWVVDHSLTAEPLNKTFMVEGTPLSKRGVFQFGEKNSDLCMKELIGTGPSNQTCTVTPFCWKLMYSHFDVSNGYQLTHNALYFYLAKLLGCGSVIAGKLAADFSPGKNYTSISDILEKACANVYLEMEDTAAHLPVAPGSDQDLFLEQGALCSIYGYAQVLRNDFVDLGGSWLNRDGCIPPYRRKRSTGGAGTRKDAEPWSTKWLSRRLLVDKDVGGCSMHSSTLALAYITAYTRHQLEESSQHLLQPQGLESRARDVLASLLQSGHRSSRLLIERLQHMLRLLRG